MRLLIKLVAMVVVFAVAQCYVMERRQEWWFAARCLAASVRDDEVMQERLIDEARQDLLVELEQRYEEAIVLAAAGVAPAGGAGAVACPVVAR